MLTRRAFFQSLAASVVAAGAVLPVGMSSVPRLSGLPAFEVLSAADYDAKISSLQPWQRFVNAELAERGIENFLWRGIPQLRGFT